MSKRVLLKNISYLFVSNVLVRFILALVTIFVARYLGAKEYGELIIGMSFLNLAIFFTDLGVSQTYIREATKKNVNEAQLVSSYLKSRMLFLLATCLILFFTVEILYKDNYIKSIVYLLVFPALIGNVLQGIGATFFQAKQKMKFTALIYTVSGLFTATTLVIITILKSPLSFIAFAYGISSLVGGVLSLLLVIKNVSSLHGWNPSILKGLTSFGFGGVILLALPQIGPLILDKVSNLNQVGYFAVAYRIPSVLFAVPSILAAAFYPLLFQYGNNKEDSNHLNTVILQIKLMSAIGMLITIPLFLFSDDWITLLFGEGWKSAAFVLRVLSLIVIFKSISIPLADSLTTKGLQRERNIVLFATLLFTLILYILLGGKLGSVGAGLAAIFSELFLLIGLIVITPKGWTVFRRSSGINICCFVIITTLANQLLPNINVYVGSFLSFVCLSLTLIVADKNVRLKIHSYRQTRFNQKNQIIQ